MINNSDQLKKGATLIQSYWTRKGEDVGSPLITGIMAAHTALDAANGKITAIWTLSKPQPVQIKNIQIVGYGDTTHELMFYAELA